MHIKPQSTELQTLSRDAFWQHHVNQWQHSGLSKRAYCTQYTLVYHQMVYWCNKFIDPADDVTTPDTRLAGFVPVSVATVDTCQQLSVRLPNGSTIEGIDQHTVQLLAQVVKQL